MFPKKIGFMAFAILLATLFVPLALYGVTPQVAAGWLHTVGLRSDGTVVATGYNYYGQCNVATWRNVVQVVAGGHTTFALKSDGTILYAGPNTWGEVSALGWTNIVQINIGSGGSPLYGLKSDGTVVTAGYPYYGMRDVGSWSNIAQICSGGFRSVGLRKDGTVVAVGHCEMGVCNVGSWTNIIQVAANGYVTVGLKQDGTVVAAGAIEYGDCNVETWTNITRVYAENGTYGLRSDGTLVFTGSDFWSFAPTVLGWSDIIQISGDRESIVGLKSDGTVVAVGTNEPGSTGALNVGNWHLIVSVEEMLAALIQQVEAIDLKNGAGYTAKLDAALASYQEATGRDYVNTINQLEAFKNKCDNDPQLSEADRATLKKTATEIIAYIQSKIQG